MLIAMILLTNLCCTAAQIHVAPENVLSSGQERDNLTSAALRVEQAIVDQATGNNAVKYLVSRVLLLNRLGLPINPLLEIQSLHAVTMQELSAAIISIDRNELTPRVARAWDLFLTVWNEYTELLRNRTGQDLKNASAALLSSLAGTPAGTARSLECAENLWRLSGKLERLVLERSLGGEEAATILDEFDEHLLELRDTLVIIPSGVQQHLFRLTKNAHILRGLQNSAPEQPLESLLKASQGDDALNSKPRGFLQRCCLGDISGWAYDPDQPNKPVAVILRVDGRFRSMHTANLPREGVPELAQTGSILHGFLFETFDLVPGESIVEIVAVDADTGDHYVISKRLVDE